MFGAIGLCGMQGLQEDAVSDLLNHLNQFWHSSVKYYMGE